MSQNPGTPAHPTPPYTAAQPGYAPPYVRPGGHAPAAYPAPPASRRRGSALGAIALAAGLVAALVVPVVAAFAAFRIGLGAGIGLADLADPSSFSWRILTPVREWVLLGEASFWVGTAFGLWALVQGIVAIVTARGRVAGIVAVVLACLGPVLFGVAVQISLSAGLAASGVIPG